MPGFYKCDSAPALIACHGLGSQSCAKGIMPSSSWHAGDLKMDSAPVQPVDTYNAHCEPSDQWEPETASLHKQHGYYYSKVTGALRACFLDGDATFLAVLAVTVAFFSFIVDDCIARIFKARIFLYDMAASANLGAQYMVWIGCSLTLVLIASSICQWITPQAIGSGLPEMKTILHGVVLKEYLTLKTLVVKAIALTLCLGSGMPIGKEGPFVHMSSIMATLLMKVLARFRTNYDNESRTTEMLSAACAVGVACTFGSPIGGVLFSVEVTSVYFAVRNYWRCFFAATWTAIIFRMCTVWFGDAAAPMAIAQTTFSRTYPFKTLELIFYLIFGGFVGIIGATFVFLHRKTMLFIRKSSFATRLRSLSRLLHPAVVTLLIISLTFPAGYGKFLVSTVNAKAAIADLFCDASWTQVNGTDTEDIIGRWTPYNVPFFVTLVVYSITQILCRVLNCLSSLSPYAAMLFQFFISILANTLPIPTGVFIPTFVTGAALGRLVGELLYMYFPDGLPGDAQGLVVPGSYALVGAAAMTGSVTRTLSTAVIVFELTGQIIYMIPVMIGVLISNEISSYLQPSIFDSIIKIKKLPYLPSLLPTESNVHTILVQDMMNRDVKFVFMETTLQRIQDLLVALPHVKSFPIVDNEWSKILLGSISRSQLIEHVEHHIGAEMRMAEAKRRHSLRRDRAPPNVCDQFRQQLTSHLPLTVQYSRMHSREQQPDHDHCNVRESLISLQPSMWSVHKLKASALDLIAKTRRFSNILLSKHRTFQEGSTNIDLTDEERFEWEQQQLETMVTFENTRIDSIAIQLLEKTTLHKAHSLFSLLSLRSAYVTRLGRLVGVVGLRDIRYAVEKQLSEADMEQEESADG